MQRTALVLLNFQSPYHVGWRTAEPVVEGFTIHRFIIYAWITATGYGSVANDLAVNLRVSAALPTIPSENCHKLLLPLPPIPSRIPLKKKRLRWITVKAALNIAREVPYIDKIGDGRITLYLRDERTELCYTNEVVHDCDEKLEAPRQILERLDIHVNRVDRATSAADVYKITAYMPLTRLGVVIQGDSGVVDGTLELFKLLGELGIGGVRSRGFGRFTTEIGALCDEELTRTKGNNNRLVLLGSYVFNDSINHSGSIVNKRSIAGYAGPPHDNYILPYLDYIGSGSILHVTQTLRPVVRNIETSHTGALMVFNPVVAGV